MLTKQDIDNMMKRGDFSTVTNGKYSEQFRMQALMEVVSKVDANDPQKIMELSHDRYKKLGLYGYEGYSNVDVATLIFRFATELQDENNFDTVMAELKKRGIPDKTFGDAFVVMQKYEKLFPAEYVKKVMIMANNQYSPELFAKIHEKDLYKTSDPWFEYAINHFDIEALEKYGVDLKSVLEIDTSKDAIRENTGKDLVKNISSKDGKHFASLNLMDIADLQKKIKKVKMSSATKNLQQQAIKETPIVGLDNSMDR